MSDRTCPVCGGTNTSAVVNDVQWHTIWVTKSSARQERHILAGCGCRDCQATWEQWDAPAGHGEPFNVSELPDDAANYADDTRLSHFYDEPEPETVTFADVVRSGDFVVLDTETTGLHDGEICEISIIDSKGNVLLDTLVKPSKPIPPDAERIHGISNEMVAKAPTWSAIRDDVRYHLTGQNVVIYNAVYDRKMMHKSDERAGLARIDYKAEAVYWCAMEAYAEHFGEWNDYHGNYRWQKLTMAAAREGVQVENAHRAKGDCLMTLGVIKAMFADD